MCIASLSVAADADSHGQESAAQVRSSEGPNLKVEIFADASMVKNVTAICFDDQGRLYVTESDRWRNGVEDNRDHLFWVMDDLASQTTGDRRAMIEKWADRFAPDFFTRESERVVRVEDSDGDGKADKQTIFADGFNDALDGPAIGLLSGFGKIYLANIPHLWTLTDADDDGVAEKRESMQDGFGPRFSLSGHDLHGLVWGPDGKLYFSMGDRGYHLKTKEGKILSDPGAGAAFRCNPDGTDLEIFYYGLRNPQELAFNEYGDLFTVDNNCDQGDAARVSYLMEGGDTGWHMGHQALTTFSDQVEDGKMEQPPHWMSEGLWKKRYPAQPAWILPAVDHLTMGPSGLVFHSGTSLSQRYKNHFLVCDYKGSSNQCFLYSFKVEQEGAGYAMRDGHIFYSGITAADVDVGYDGKVYLGDFGGGWRRTDKGNIFALSDPEHLDNPVVQETKDVFALGFNHRSSEELSALLSHADMRVRLRAQYALVAKASDTSRAALVNAVTSNPNLFARLHGTWGLRQLDDHATLIALLRDSEAELRAQAARALGDLGAGNAAEALTPLLGDESARVQAFSALALGKLGHRGAMPGVLTFLEANAGVDVFLQHGGIMALKGIAQPAELAKLAQHQSRHVRLAAAIALRKLEHPDIAVYLQDPDTRIAEEALRAINDLNIEPALEAAADANHDLVRDVAANLLPDEPIFRRVINVNFRLGSGKGAKRLLLMGANPSLPLAYRVASLRALSVWPNPPSIDPTLGKYRPLDTRDSSVGLSAIRVDLRDLLASTKETEIAHQALRVAEAFGMPVEFSKLRRFLLDRHQGVETRRQALQMIEENPPRGFDADLQRLYLDQSAPMRVAAAETTVRLFPQDTTLMVRLLLRGGSTGELRGAYKILAESKEEDGIAILAEQLEALAAGTVPAATRLDLLEVANQRTEPAIAERVAKVTAQLATKPIGQLAFSHDGGDSDRGERLFANQGTCKKCHRVEGDDSEDAGPTLEGIATRLNSDQLLHSLVFPGEEVVDGYGIASITKKDGTIVAGTPIKETDTTVVIKTPDSDPVTVAKADIQVRTPAISPMPPMGLALPAKDIRDLMAYLKTLK